MRRNWIVLLILFDATLALAQFERTYTPAQFLDTIPNAVNDSLKARLVRKVKLITGKSAQRSFTKSLYEKHNEALLKFYNDDFFITNDELTDYLQSVLRQVLKVNPQIKGNLSIYAFRSSYPNALTFWDGTIGVTLGLLARLNNEDELAFVICHELGHYYDQHIDKRIAEIARINYDPSIEKEIKSIKYERFEKYTKLKKLFNDLGLSIYHHNRKEEFRADSIGLMFMMHTSYHSQASLRVMEILDSANVSRYNAKIDLRNLFSFPNNPFKEQWLEYSKTNMAHKTEVEEFGDSDTTRTHPDCKRRIVALKNILTKNGVSIMPISNTNALSERMGKRSEFEMIESENHFRHYGKSLFLSLEFLQRYPDNFYLHGMVGRNLAQIYLSMKGHQFGKVVSFPDDRYEESYNLVLSFLQKLRIMEVASLAYNYMVSKPEVYFQDEEFLFSLWYSAQMPMSEFSAVSVRQDYLKQFPSGYHSSFFKSKSAN